MDKEKVREYVKTSENLDDKEMNKALLELFPYLTPRNCFSGKSILDCRNEDGEDGFWPGSPDEHPDYDYEYTELNQMQETWRKVFGFEMCEEIEKEYEKMKDKDAFYIVQIKEKFGMLRFYTSCTTDEIEEIIAKYEDMSEKICFNCGKPATKQTSGWILNLCDECYAKERKGEL